MKPDVIQGLGLSTEDLFTQAFAQLRQLKNRASTRQGRERALELVTALFLTVDGIARHVGALTFTERPVCMDEEEDDTLNERMSMAELMHDSAEVENLVEVDDIEELRAQNEALRKSRLQYFQDFLDYFAKGSRQEADITRKVLACIRRVRPHILQQFGLSQADVARKLGEVRATVSAREKREVQKKLKAAGAHGVLSNGARSEATSQACAKAAKGNRNRRNSKAKQSRNMKQV